MTRYLMLLAYEPTDWDAFSPQEQDKFFRQHRRFEAYVDERGRRRESAALADSTTATTVRHVEGAATVTDGPFAETTEMIGGYYDVDLPDLDTAITAAKLLPRGYAVEIRPTITIEGYE